MPPKPRTIREGIYVRIIATGQTGIVAESGETLCLVHLLNGPHAGSNVYFPNEELGVLR